ncbi:family 78 glycoside hydrolase catalytic domain [Streptomyces sp. 6N223]|uniref:family 78 glycoside hydrolase catalytic domain n=1 Tax=Streptomyces sp. 6N223 TaxID=3457412 RepID=UPI003FD21EBD
MAADRPSLRVYALHADGRTDPVGVASPRPVLSWKFRATDRVPATIQLELASTRDLLVTGQPDAGRFSFPFTGLARLPWPVGPLASRERRWWRLRAIDTEGRAGPWSPPAVVEAPLWHAEDWSARWITHPAWATGPGTPPPAALPVLRHEFRLDAPARSARLYLTGAGVVVPSLNGTDAIAGRLEPGHSSQSKRLPASAWDVTRALRAGLNVLALQLGTGTGFVEPIPGRYTKLTRDALRPQVLAQLDIVTADGDSVCVATGPQWLAALGGTTVGHWYGGEDHDARVLAPGWDEPGFDTSSWVPAAPLPAPRASLWWRRSPAVTVTDTLAPAAVTPLPDGEAVVDFGVNAAGWPLLRVDPAPAGRTITLTPSELLTGDGRADQSTTGGPTWDSYTTDGSEAQWHPRFVYHGCRYVQAKGLSADEAALMRFQVLRAGNERVGSFTTDDHFLAALHRVIDRAVQSNMSSVFTDCPHREKLGWLEQLYLNFEVLARNYDVQAQLTDAVLQMIDAQTDSGLVPSIAPEYVVFDIDEVDGDRTAFRDDPNWGRALVEVPWRLYRTYGDEEVLRTAWPAIRRYLGHLDSRASGHLLDHGLGDWIALDRSTPRALVATSGYADAVGTAARIATVLGEAGRATELLAHETAVRRALKRRFHDAATGSWGSGSQGSFALGLASQTLTADEYAHSFTGLLASVEAAQGHITVGENTLPALIRALTDNGHADLLNEMIRRTDGPGYGHQIASGATALTESWQGPAGPAGQGSQNHFMLGMIDEWILGDVVGLRQAPDSIGWRQVEIRPRFLAGVGAARTTFDSPQGLITVAWTRGPDAAVKVELPAGVTGTLRLPGNLVSPGNRPDVALSGGRARIPFQDAPLRSEG